MSIVDQKQVGAIASAVSLGASGVLGAAAAVVDHFRLVPVAATATGLFFTLPNPTDTTDPITVKIVNTGSNAFTMYGLSIPAGQFADFVWQGSTWRTAAASSGGSVGANFGQTTSLTTLTGGTGGQYWSLQRFSSLPAGTYLCSYTIIGQANSTNGFIYAGISPGCTNNLNNQYNGSAPSILNYHTVDSSSESAPTISGSAIVTITAGQNIDLIVNTNYNAGPSAAQFTYVQLGAPGVNVFGGATASAAGTAGSAPAPAAGQQASFLRGDATWAVPSSASVQKVTDFVGGSSGTFTPLATTTWLEVEMWGGGGGGGGANGLSTGACVGEAGSGGGYLRFLIPANTEASYAVTAGAAGAGGQAGQAGGNGGVSTFGGIATAGAGRGGSGQTTTNFLFPGVTILSNNSWSFSSGYIIANIAGETSQAGVGVSAIAIGGQGGCSFGSKGGAGSMAYPGFSAPGNSPAGLGAGGSGAVCLSTTVSQTGAAGGPGAVWIREYS